VNVSSKSLKLKLLTEVVPDSATVNIIKMEHHDKTGLGEPRPIEEIHARADAMTSLLKGILEMHPATHWGINE
jgi:hypothetical protein